MLENFINTLSAGTLEWLRPKKLVEAIHNSCRIVAEHFSGTDGVTNTKYDCYGVRSQFDTISIPAGNIVTSSVVAGIDVANTNTIAGSNYHAFPFFVTGLPKDIVCIGKSPDSELGMLYRDFIPYGKGYLFQSHPATYGSVDTRSGEPRVSFYYVGGKMKAKDQPQFKHVYADVVNKDVCEAVSHSGSEALVCAGVSNVPVNTAAGVSTVATDSRITEVRWVEGNKAFIGTETAIYHAPSDTTLVTVERSTLSRGESVTSDHLSSTVVFPIGDTWYWVDGRRINDSCIPATVYTEYPQLTDSSPLLPQLRTLMRSKGICAVNVSEGVDNTADIALLRRNLPDTGSLHLIKYLDVDLSERDKNGVEDVDTIYILYSLSGDHIVPYDVTPVWMIRTSTESRGCLRVSNCINTGNVLYGISSNSTVYGARITDIAKIYGIVAVSGGKQPQEDIVYSYRNLPPTSFGAGLEIIITALI